MYIEELEKQPTIKAAFRSYWENKGVSVDSIESDYLRPYNDEIKGVPNITIKVPTAGGKTFLACKSLKHILQKFSDNKPKVVVWFVPSDPILKQTYNNLSNPNHPYRHALDVDFGSKVQIVNKESALAGENIHPSQLKENLTILVLSVQSFASNSKEGRKSRRENENLAEHVSSYTYNDKMLANALVSFSCAMQVQAFRKVKGYPFASTMCIGNLRSGMESLCAYRITHNAETLYKAASYFGIIILFGIGAGLGGYFLPLLDKHTIWLSCLLLFFGFLLMFIKEEIEEELSEIL